MQSEAQLSHIRTDSFFFHEYVCERTLVQGRTELGGGQRYPLRRPVGQSRTL